VDDLAWNSTTISFTIDKTDPWYAWVSDWIYYNTDVTITYSDINISWATLNWSPYASWTVISADNSYVFYADDLAWNSVTINFTVDQSPPTASVSYSPSSLTNTDVIATLTGQSEPITIDSTGGNTHTFVIDWIHLFEFHDLAWNTWENLATVNWIDKVLPVLSWTSTITSSNTNTSFAKVWDVVTITFSVTENLMANPTVSIVWWWTMNFASKIWNTYSYNRNMTSWDPNWIISISIAMEDLATNVNSETEISTITFDKTSPAWISITSPSTEERLKWSNGVDPNINYTIVRNVWTETNYWPNPLQIQYSSLWDFSDTYDISTGTDNDWAYIRTMPVWYNTDTALIRIIATDNAWNSTTFNWNSFNIDSIRPTEITITTPNGLEYLKWWDEYDIAYNGWVESNIATKQYSLYRNSVFNRNLSVTPLNKWTIPSDLNSQSMVMRITVTDNAWWSNDGDSLAFTIDNTDPTLSFTNNSARRNTTVVWNTTVWDNFALRLTWSNAVYGSTAFTDSCDGWTLTVPTYSVDGTYTSYACVADRAWNVTTWEQDYNIDKTDPFVDAGTDKIVNGVSSQDTNIYDILSWWVMSNINTIVRSQDSWPWVASYNPLSTWDTDISASLDGDYVLRVTATDNAWNSSSDTIDFTRDTTDPIITWWSVVNTDKNYPWYDFESNEEWTISYSWVCANWSISTVSVWTNTFNYSSRWSATYANCQLIITDLAGNEVIHTLPTFTVNLPSWWGGWWGWGLTRDDCELWSDLPWANEEWEDYSDSNYDQTCVWDMEEEDEEEEETEEEDEDEEEDEEVTVVLYGNDKNTILDLIEVPDFDNTSFGNTMWIIADYIAGKVSKKSIPVSELWWLISYFNTFLDKFADYKNDWNEAAKTEAVVALSTFMSQLNQYPDVGSSAWWDELSMAIQFLYQNGLTKYSEKSTFRPDALITREQAAKFLVGYAEKVKWATIDQNKTYVFADINDWDPSLKDYVLKSYQMWIFNGYWSVFKPHWNLTRWWAIAVLLRVYYGEWLSEYSYPRYKNYYNKASWVMTWDTILDYAVYLIKFIGQLALLVWAIMIIYFGYKKATEHIKFNGTLWKVVVWILIISFAYVIVKIVWSMFVS